MRYLLLCAATLFVLTACSGIEIVPEYPDRPEYTDEPVYGERESVFGEGGLFGPAQRQAGGDGVGVSVNAFLWRATLDTLSFLPLQDADPFGGTILSDWYAPPQSPDERFRVNAFILDKQLRADGVRVSVFRQVKNRSGQWVDAEVPETMGRQLEDTILTRARELKIAQAAS